MIQNQLISNRVRTSNHLDQLIQNMLTWSTRIRKYPQINYNHIHKTNFKRALPCRKSNNPKIWRNQTRIMQVQFKRRKSPKPGNLTSKRNSGSMLQRIHEIKWKTIINWMNWHLNNNRFKSLDNNKIPNQSMMSRRSWHNQLRTKQWYSPRILKIHRWVRDRIIKLNKKASKTATSKQQPRDNAVRHLNRIR